MPMRLVDTTNLRVLFSNPEGPPPYAILSHTWGSEYDEVTLQELQSLATLPAGHDAANRVTAKPGFAKLRGAAGLARENGYQYIWVDTCCIDRTSSAELSEALNSMWRWYHEAAVCFAYLSDVNRPRERVLAVVAPELRASRYFTRGWTLQELIAPREMSFFARDWTYLGQKSKATPFRSLLAEITGIDEFVLGGLTRLDEISVAQRMKWASGRNTAKVEDLAYCLMGIFSVTMPILYGEGNRAFIRLQEEIIKDTDDHSIFAWKSPDNETQPDRLCGLLAPSPKYFSNSGSARPLPPAQSGDATAVTGKGIRLHLKVVSTKDGGQLAVLDCSPIHHEPFYGNETQHEEHLFTIHIRRLGGDQYARYKTNELPSLAASALAAAKSAAYRTIYVQQSPQYRPPDILLRIPAADQLFDYNIRMKEVYPSARWNTNGRSLLTVADRLWKVMGVFLFEITVPSTNEKVELVFRVQLKPEADGRWSCHSEQWANSKITVPLDHFYDRPGGEVASEVMPSTMAPPVYQSYFTYLTTLFGLKAKMEIRTMHGREFGVIDFAFPDETAAQTVEHVNALERSDALRHIWAVEGMRTIIGAGLSKVTEGITVIDSVNISLFPAQRSAWPALSASKIRVRPRGLAIQSHEGQLDILEALKYLLSTMTHEHLRVIELDGVEFGEDADHQYAIKHSVVSGREGRHGYIRAGMEQRTLDTLVAWNNEKMQTANLEGIPGFVLPPAYWAALQGRASFVKELLGGFDVNLKFTTTYGISFLHVLILGGSTDLIRYFLKDQAAKLDDTFDLHQSTSIYGDTAGHFAAAYGEMTAAESFLTKTSESEEVTEPGFSINARPVLAGWAKTWLNQAADSWKSKYAKVFPMDDKTGDVDMVQNHAGETPLHRAAAMGNGVALLALLEHVADLDGVDNDGRTPLWHAAAAGSLLETYLLLESGADLNKADNLGRTPLVAACLEGHERIVELLLHKGADRFLRTAGLGFTALHLASALGHTACVRILLSHGSIPADTWQQSLQNAEEPEVPPVHLAAANGWLECVRLFHERGWDMGVASPYVVLVDRRAAFGRLAVFGRPTGSAVEAASVCGQRAVGVYFGEMGVGGGGKEYLTDIEVNNLRLHSRPAYE